MYKKILIVCFSWVIFCGAEYKELNCVANGAYGKCMLLRLCPSAIKDIKQRIQPQICSFNPTSLEPIVCCLGPSETSTSDTQTSIKRTVQPDLMIEASIPAPSTAQLNNTQASVPPPKAEKPSNATSIIEQSVTESSKTNTSVFVNNSGTSISESTTAQASTSVRASQEISDELPKDQCPPLQKEYLPKKKEISVGKKAWEKCVEYQQTAVFPCEKNSSLRLDFCPSHNATGRRELVIGGGRFDAERGQFPHMALLGYGRSHDDAWWSCGGTLISEKFILTAGNCLSISRTRNITRNGQVQEWTAPEKVTYAAMGVLDRSESLDLWDIYGIKNIIKHPKYILPIKYDDIALLETDRVVQFSDLVLPACLHVGDDILPEKAKEIGWGAEGYHWNTDVDVLLQIPVWKVSDDNCSFHYFPYVTFKRGYDNETQVCYVDDRLSRETCRGDNGGPLQISSPDIYCMTVVIGVTSFATVQCSSIGYPGIYTRVAPYVPWIESIVWP